MLCSFKVVAITTNRYVVFNCFKTQYMSQNKHQYQIQLYYLEKSLYDLILDS